MSEQQKSKLELNQNWNVIIKVFNDDWNHIDHKDLIINTKSWKQTLQNNWTIIFKWDKSFKIWQLKNLQKNEELISFVNFPFEDRFTEICNWNWQLNYEYFEAWLSFFKDYNYDQSELYAYLYKIKKDEQEYIESLLEHLYHWKEYKIVIKQEEKWAHFKYFDFEIDSWDSLQKYTYEKTKELIDKAIQEHTVDNILSFFLWLYCDWFVNINYLYGIKFQIPLVKLIEVYREILYNIFHYLKKYFVLSEKEEWKIYTVSSLDWEFEVMMNMFFSKFLKWTQQYSNETSKLVDKKLFFWWYFTDNKDLLYKNIITQNKRERLFTFFDEIEFLENWIMFINMVEHSHIKFIKK